MKIMCGEEGRFRLFHVLFLQRKDLASTAEPYFIPLGVLEAYTAEAAAVPLAAE
jgi:hypothetical protein